MAPALALAALIEAAERLAATDELPGPSRLWAGEEGEALATRLAEVQAALPLLPDQRRDVLPGLLDAVLEGAVVRSRRALRGRDGTEHPRVFIWGLLEARLQTADVMVLGGLAEGVWPPASDPGAWLSRPMRATVGLPSPEEIVGQSAHDFVSCAVRRADGRAVLSAAAGRRAGGAGALAHPAGDVAGRPGEGAAAASGRGLGACAGSAGGRAASGAAAAAVPAGRAAAAQAVGDRDRDLAARSLRDPRAPRAEAETACGRSTRRRMRRTTAAWCMPGCTISWRSIGTRWPADAAEAVAAGDGARPGRGRICARRWPPGGRRGWSGSPIGSRRLEAERRSVRPPVALVAEASGTLELERPGGLFRLIGRADRIERRRDGGLAILDYKTGTPPSQKEVDAGLAPQLLLEAAMAEAGAFGEAIAGAAEELTYWHLTGGFHAGELRTLFKADAASDRRGGGRRRARRCAR